MLQRHALPILLAVLGFGAAQPCVAQGGKAISSVLCRSKTSGVVTAKAKCRANEIRVNPQASRFAGCSWKLGTPVSLAGQTGQVTVSESCLTNQVLVNHVLSHNELNSGIVSISSETFTAPPGATHSLPQGVTVRLNLVSTSGIQPPIPAEENISAELNLLCCPFD